MGSKFEVVDLSDEVFAEKEFKLEFKGIKISLKWEKRNERATQFYPSIYVIESGKRLFWGGPNVNMEKIDLKNGHIYIKDANENVGIIEIFRQEDKINIKNHAEVRGEKMHMIPLEREYKSLKSYLDGQLIVASKPGEIEEIKDIYFKGDLEMIGQAKIDKIVTKGDIVEIYNTTGQICVFELKGDNVNKLVGFNENVKDYKLINEDVYMTEGRYGYTVKSRSGMILKQTTIKQKDITIHEQDGRYIIVNSTEKEYKDQIYILEKSEKGYVVEEVYVKDEKVRVKDIKGNMILLGKMLEDGKEQTLIRSLCAEKESNIGGYSLNDIHETPTNKLIGVEEYKNWYVVRENDNIKLISKLNPEQKYNFKSIHKIVESDNGDLKVTVNRQQSILFEEKNVKVKYKGSKVNMEYDKIKEDIMNEEAIVGLQINKDKEEGRERRIKKIKSVGKSKEGKLVKNVVTGILFMAMSIVGMVKGVNSIEKQHIKANIVANIDNIIAQNTEITDDHEKEGQNIRVLNINNINSEVIKIVNEEAHKINVDAISMQVQENTEVETNEINGIISKTEGLKEIYIKDGSKIDFEEIKELSKSYKVYIDYDYEIDILKKIESFAAENGNIKVCNFVKNNEYIGKQGKGNEKLGELDISEAIKVKEEYEKMAKPIMVGEIGDAGFQLLVNSLYIKENFVIGGKQQEGKDAKTSLSPEGANLLLRDILLAQGYKFNLVEIGVHEEDENDEKDEKVGKIIVIEAFMNGKEDFIIFDSSINGYIVLDGNGMVNTPSEENLKDAQEIYNEITDKVVMEQLTV
ncbi:MAG TPA: hypothetical protein DEP72_05065 [Clostridiales bacterium]|nr:MAG: hypothetical protein A2Y18_00525 [Clostridiales bacterium GWD2_32_19]HCC07511.1 hypothetical protein [Clostridiales bacterium]